MPGGRPTVFKAEYINLAYNYCLLGSTDEQLAVFFDVCTSTIDTWKREKPKFLGSIKKGKALADAQVAASLHKKALGYTRTEDKVSVYMGDASHYDQEVYYPPDTTSAIFWLKNRQPDLWRDKHDITHSGGVTHTDMTDDQLDRRLQELRDELEQSEQT